MYLWLRLFFRITPESRCHINRMLFSNLSPFHVVAKYSSYQFNNRLRRKGTRLFNTIKEDFFDLYIYNEYYVENRHFDTETFEALAENDLMWTDVSAKLIYGFEQKLVALKPYIILAGILSLAGILLTFVLLISYSIKDQSKLLGIMRSLGFTKKDISRIFVFQAMLVGVLCVLFALFAFIIIKNYANSTFASSLPEYSFDLLVFRPLHMIISAIISLVLCLLSSILPIARLARKKPFDLIHF